jgi:hypothetical protein
MSDYKEVFSRNLRFYMDRNNKSQVDLIADLGFNKSSVSTWVNGSRLPRIIRLPCGLRRLLSAFVRNDVLTQGIR